MIGGAFFFFAKAVQIAAALFLVMLGLGCLLARGDGEEFVNDEEDGRDE